MCLMILNLLSNKLILKFINNSFLFLFMKSEKKILNYYKISTFILVSVIILAGLFFAFNYYSDYKYFEGVRYGRDATINDLLGFVSKDGFVTIYTEENNLTLVPSQFAAYQKEKTILDIMNLVKENGYVSLHDNETELILVEYIEPSASLESIN